MAIEVGIWRIDEGTNPIKLTGFDIEDRLEDAIDQDVSILDEQLMIIGRQVRTAFGTQLDLLAIDEDGDLIVIELKRDKTPRDIVAQALDYGSWVHSLTISEIEEIYADFQNRYGDASAPKALADAMRDKFKGEPEEYNASHRLLITASTLDPTTERIVEYLRDIHKVDINVALFQAFVDSGRQYIVRAWLGGNVRLSREEEDPNDNDVEWNEEYFVNVGECEYRSWSDARRYGFVSAGGAKRFEDAMKRLREGDRIWAYVSGHGYVGYGEVHTEARNKSEFTVSAKGTDLAVQDVKLDAQKVFEEGHEEWFVGVEWIHSVPREEAIWQKGMYYARGVSVRPRKKTWLDTNDELKRRWEGLESL
jgi:hypothetical protein